jgi:hypothetical protein
VCDAFTAGHCSVSARARRAVGDVFLASPLPALQRPKGGEFVSRFVLGCKIMSANAAIRLAVPQKRQRKGRKKTVRFDLSMGSGI